MSTAIKCDICGEIVPNGTEFERVVIAGQTVDFCASCTDELRAQISAKPARKKRSWSPETKVRAAARKQPRGPHKKRNQIVNGWPKIPAYKKQAVKHDPLDDVPLQQG